jgi:hypothetical protein
LSREKRKERKKKNTAVRRGTVELLQVVGPKSDVIALSND